MPSTPEFRRLIRLLADVEHQKTGKRWSYTAVADRAELSTSHVTQLESGRAAPKPYSVEKLARAYPEYAFQLYASAGLEPPVSLIYGSMPRDVREIHECIVRVAHARSIAVGEVVPELLREECERIAENVVDNAHD